MAKRPFLSWWTSIETDVRKSILVWAQRDRERLHALIRMAYEAGQQAESAQPGDEGEKN